MSESKIARFERQFPTVWRMVEASEHYRIDIIEPFEDRIGIGSTGTVLFRHANNRAFGAVWRAEKAALIGLGARHYDANLPDDHPANASFLAELARRLKTHGATQGEITGRAGGGYHPRHRARWRQAFAATAY
ncbi:hypothetical protein [Methylocystis sp. S23]